MVKCMPGQSGSPSHLLLDASEAGTLKKHVLSVHDKVKPFKCELCEYAASEAGNLKRHVLGVHEKMKNFKCKQCD